MEAHGIASASDLQREAERRAAVEQHAVVHALGELGPQAAPAVRLLAENLKDADANVRWREAKRDAETRRAVSAEARRRRSESAGGGARGDSDDGFGTDADGGTETSDDESDGTPRRDAGTRRQKGKGTAFTFAEDARDDEEGGMRSYRALVSGRG